MTWRPIACVAISDRQLSTTLVDALHRQGYCVLEHTTGFELIGTLADLIERGNSPWRPQLIVAEVRSKGCSGPTIASGLHDLGIHVPIILIGDPATPCGDRVHVVDAEVAATRVPDLARRWAPVRVLDDDHPARETRVLA